MLNRYWRYKGKEREKRKGGREEEDKEEGGMEERMLLRNSEVK
jgi:hypothetical protein